MYRVTSSSFASPERSGNRLRGIWLHAARFAWAAIAALTIGFFLASIPTRLAQLHSVASRNQAALEQVGLSDHLLAIYVTSLDVIVFASFVLIAVIVFARKPDDRVAMFVSLALMTLVTVLIRPVNSMALLDQSLRLPYLAILCLGSSSVVVFLFLFPDGRFVPRWTRWLSLVWVLGLIWWYFSPAVLDGPGPSTTRALPIVVVLLFLATGLLAQGYRYWRVSDQTAKQQTKWVVLGLALGAQGLLWFSFLAPILYPAFERPGLARVFYIVVGIPIFYASIVLLPASIGLSILRFRLWDIDGLINRTLVYAILTAVIAILYGASIILGQQVFRLLAGERSAFFIAISTLAIAAMFQPLRRRVQTFVDRRFSRSHYEATRTLTAFAATMRDEVDITRLADDLVRVVEDTMRPSHVSLWLRKDYLGAPLTREATVSLPSKNGADIGGVPVSNHVRD
jgi:hypothetical protein